MSKYIPGNQKHLTLNDRIYIENELAKGTPFKDIAAFLCKDPTTISKEVRAHRLSDWYHKGTFYNAKNFCIHRYHCQKTNACGKILLCGIKCASLAIVTVKISASHTTFQILLQSYLCCYNIFRFRRFLYLYINSHKHHPPLSRRKASVFLLIFCLPCLLLWQVKRM